jgi:hypothetical protein
MRVRSGRLDFRRSPGYTRRMALGVLLPTKVRTMSVTEYHIVSGIFGGTLPHRSRILVTNAAGFGGRAFTIPTSLVSSFFSVTPALFLPTAIAGYLGSVANLAYLMNVGKDYNALGTSQQHLLVHETTHVWQGKNSTLALTYVFSSLLNQGLHGSAAYTYTPGQPWRSYNAEQQAAIVEGWFRGGQPKSGPLYPYIVNHVRKGDC